MNVIRAWTRMVLVILSMIIYIMVFYLFLPLKKDSLKWGLSLRRSWMKLAHGIMGIRVNLLGKVPEGACLVVCNHQSALDPIVVMRYKELFPVGKHEIRSYPLIGFASEKTGILFVNRDERDHRRAIRKKVEEFLGLGRSILLFPEGTVSAGSNLLPFRPGSFQSAINAGVPVVPTAILFKSSDIPWKDGDSLYRHMISQLGKRRIDANLIFLDPVHGLEPSELAANAREAIISQFGGNL